MESSWNTCLEKVSNACFIIAVRGWIRENQRFFLLSGRNTTWHSKCVIPGKKTSTTIASSTWNVQELSFCHAHERCSAFVGVNSMYVLCYNFFHLKTVKQKNKHAAEEFSVANILLNLVYNKAWGAFRAAVSYGYHSHSKKMGSIIF